MEDRKKTEQKESNTTEEGPEPVLTGTVVPNEKWEDHARYMREVVNPDNT